MTFFAAFKRLYKKTPRRMKKWMQYVRDTYVLGKRVKGGYRTKPMFRPRMWSVYKRVLNNIPRNTNAHESWHARMGKLVNIKKVRVWALIEHLRQEQKAADGRAFATLALANPQQKKNRKRRDKRIYRIVSNYASYPVTLDYLEAIAANF